jgi:hypothetical protein
MQLGSATKATLVQRQGGYATGLASGVIGASTAQQFRLNLPEPLRTAQLGAQSKGHLAQMLGSSFDRSADELNQSEFLGDGSELTEEQEAERQRRQQHQQRAEGTASQAERKNSE